MSEFTVSTDERTQAIDATDQMAAALPADAEGTCTVFVECDGPRQRTVRVLTG